MRDRDRLGGLENDQLLAALSALVRREHELLSDFLAHLAELDQRRLYLDLGFSSLFAFCTAALGLSRSSAGRRIAAARVCRRFPDAFTRAARGELELSVLCELSRYLNPENATELFDACSGKSYELVLELLAARFPKPDLRDSIRRLPVPAGGFAPNVECATGAMMDARSAEPPNAPTLADSVDAPNSPVISRASTAPSAPVQRASAPAQRALEPLSADHFGVRFTADAEFRELLEEVRALASHREPSGDLMTLMKRGLEAYKRELQKERFGVGRKPRRAPSKLGRAPAERSRHVPAAIAREVYLRDGGRCTFGSDDGRHCSGRRFLELDHVKPWAVGGEPTVKNLRLRCRAHNQLSARKYFDPELIRARVELRRKRQGSSTA